jgi:hypothetical protein
MKLTSGFDESNPYEGERSILYLQIPMAPPGSGPARQRPLNPAKGALSFPLHPPFQPLEYALLSAFGPEDGFRTPNLDLVARGVTRRLLGPWGCPVPHLFRGDA